MVWAIVLGILAVIGAAIGIGVYIFVSYDRSPKGQAARWNCNRQLIELWLRADLGVKLPSHLARLRRGLKSLLEEVPPWPSSNGDDEWEPTPVPERRVPAKAKPLD